MQSKKRLILFVTPFIVVLGFLTIAVPLFAATQERVLYSFGNGKDGSLPFSGLIFDEAGNLYGTTFSGGDYGKGTVFELTPGTSGTWTETVLYSFCSASNCSDGSSPQASLIFDTVGNLYGTTAYGGSGNCIPGCGTVFQLAPGANGTWTETVLHTFEDNGEDGYYPLASLLFDAAGNLYGTTYGGGAHNVGTVFQLAPGENGAWTEIILHSFSGNGEDGYYPLASLLFDAAGNLYGTSYYGGAYGLGTVFQLAPGANGKWTETVLHRFGKGEDGSEPHAGLIFDAAGNLYGSTADGGAYNAGAVFQLTAGTHGKWLGMVAHSFKPKITDGYLPLASLIFDAAGNLYGTTYLGGASGTACSGGGCGTVFQLTPESNGKWKEQVLYSFTDNGTDGWWPTSCLVFDAVGNLYGTTEMGGAYNGGSVFEITP